VNTQGRTVVIEKPSRDHTENMLQAFGCEVKTEKVEGGRNRITIDRDLTAPNAQLQATHLVIPGDPSSAAFAMVAALIVPLLSRWADGYEPIISVNLAAK